MPDLMRLLGDVSARRRHAPLRDSYSQPRSCVWLFLISILELGSNDLRMSDPAATTADDIFTVTFFKQEEFQKTAFGLKVWGGAFVALGSISACAAMIQSLSAKIEYQAKVIESHADAFSKESGLPVEWTVTYERIPTGTRFKHTVNQKQYTKDVVTFLESKKGVRRIRENYGLIGWSIAFLTVGSSLLYLGFSGNFPTWTYWPPRVRYQ